MATMLQEMTRFHRAAFSSAAGAAGGRCLGRNADEFAGSSRRTVRGAHAMPRSGPFALPIFNPFSIAASRNSARRASLTALPARKHRRKDQQPSSRRRIIQGERL